MQYITSLPNENYNSTFPRKLTICGSTGSIGVSTLKIVEEHKELFEVVALGAGKNINLLAKQALDHRPKYLTVQTEALAKELAHILHTEKGYNPQILFGQSGYEEIASLEEITTFVSAQVGASGLRATFAAAKTGKVICLANKESLVLAGSLLRETCRENNSSILPIDSEHHALFQCLLGHSLQDVKKLVLTASGGAFRTKSYEFLQNAKAADALKHPTWAMGAKITIDSATMMNKGFEIIEACHLYGMDMSAIDVVVHPQSTIHSMVEYKDNSFAAHLSSPDMRLPIAHCLLYPRMPEANICKLPMLDVIKLGSLTFEEVNVTNFHCLELAKLAYQEKKCIALNAANEIVVEAFLLDKISFFDIARIIEKVLEKAHNDSNNLDDILNFDNEYRILTSEKIKNL